MSTDRVSEHPRRLAIDAATALRLVRELPDAGARVPLVGPAVLRSHVLALLWAEVRAGSLDERTALAQLERLASLKVRLLGDRVSRATAWRVARDLGWDDPLAAEYLAVAVLQADALVADDARLVAGATRLVPVVGFDALVAQASTG
ncbi:hypothetical protein Slu03_01910 [Sediminihabitans luteus]|nr:hypothetical protein Slu03_01910 [Sediminihabitans luteus]